ncbi:hypothetical protein N0V90_003566 [Kalmusia sp. IMI 367209]|nr:hypothetical protein N0V90_003566 [Kalmusia sp. IMI 367209]
MFMRNITYAMLFGDSIEDLFEISIPNPTSYDSPSLTFNELQMSSFQLRNASALFVRNMAMKVFLKAPLMPEDFARQSQLREAHYAWYKALQKLEHAACLKHEEEVMAASLKMGYYNTYIMVGCAMDARHTIFDAYLDYFKAINHNAKIVLDSMSIVTPSLPVSSGTRRGLSRKNIVASDRASGSKNTPKADSTTIKNLSGAHFTFEVSLIPSLHFVATRCRCPLVRREAVALLKTNPPREGFWDADTHIAVANRLIEVEETNLDPRTGWPAASSRLSCSFPSGSAHSNGKIVVTFAFAEWGLA